MELITPEINRSLVTSLGNWAGDAQWEYGPEYGKTSMAHFTFLNLIDHLQMTLLYPYVTVKPGKYISFSQLLMVGYHVNPVNWMVTLTDFVFTLTYQSFSDGSSGWGKQGSGWVIDPSWDIPSTEITIEAWTSSLDTPHLWLKDFSLLYTPLARLDHLPMMGVH